MKYRARLVENGHVLAEQEFTAENDQHAWTEANEGTDVLTDTRWVEVTRVRERRVPANG
jgi:hypothetical protein